MIQNTDHANLPVVNKTRNGTEWNGMEKVDKTRNGTAELAQSTPTHPWPTELRPRKLFVHAEVFSRNGWKADYSIPAHILELSLMRQLSTMMMMTIQCCNALAAAPLKNIVHILARNLTSYYTLKMLLLLLQKLGIMEIKLVIMPM